ncbi:MAG: hypothetical protein KR126chlam5_00563 [Candidatus Anoxychlamydiales bacterium]|nr:hypothetical protein [Candidatus Anoxychlamydiales bacterium]
MSFLSKLHLPQPFFFKGKDSTEHINSIPSPKTIEKNSIDINPVFGFDFSSRKIAVRMLHGSDVDTRTAIRIWKPINSISKIAGYILGFNFVVGICRIACNAFLHLSVSKENRSVLNRQIVRGFAEFFMGPTLFFVDLISYYKEKKVVDVILKNLAINNPKSSLSKALKETLNATPAFNFYGFEKDPKVHLTYLDVRPSNLFFEALKVPTTQPGTGELFAFVDSHEEVRKYIYSLPDSHVIQFNAKGKKTKRYEPGPYGATFQKEENLSDYLGSNTFKISAKEIKDMLNDQKVHISPLIPKAFYLGLKKAFDESKLVILPGDEGDMWTMTDLLNKGPKPVKDFLQNIKSNPKDLGFVKNDTMLSFEDVMDLTLYQVAALVIKTDKYYSYVDKGYKIRKREPNTKDDILLISACGIRGFATPTNLKVKNNNDHTVDRKIMTHTYKTAFEAAKNGYAVFPAVGLGVWRGDPNVYWRAFFDALLQSKSSPEKIFVNPRHRNTPRGIYKNCDGTEFESILQEYKKKHSGNKNLDCIVNLYDEKTDLLLLAQNLKLKFPEKVVALFNASDPDVTLGNHVGEYVNNICHADTTEENFTASGSNFGFEKITGVRNDSSRILQND